MKNKYQGYGYHGGGRKKLPDSEKVVFKNVTISGTVEEIEKIKSNAKSSGKSTSRYVIECCLGVVKATDSK